LEHDWERTFPFLEIDEDIVNTLFEGVLDGKDIINVIAINEGCRTTNYIIETNDAQSKYILKIFFTTEKDHKKEIKLLRKLKENKGIPVPKIYKVSDHEIIENREYAIYEYVEGTSIGQAVDEGYVIKEVFIRDVARALAQMHNYRFNKAGFLDEDLKLKEELPSLTLWYGQFMGEFAQKRLGKNTVEKINRIVNENKKNLIKLDEDIRLVHGDFQGTNILIKDDKLSGILDWEFVMAGHPLADIGQFFRYEEYFNENLIKVFENEYNKHSSYKLIDEWYKVSKLRDLANVIQLLNANKDMPNKYATLKNIVNNTLKLF
jgi:aminoglycoside phosphotransferase (APT) family kinase protein